MNAYIVDAMAPLVFRSGKPFGASAGADGGNFPLPSSVAGMFRTLHAEQQGLPYSTTLQEIAVAGPLLASRQLQSGEITPLFPKPADAIYMKDEAGEIQVLKLVPAPLPAGSGCDLPSGLLPVQMEIQLDGKPCPGPQFWSFSHLMQWQNGERVDISELKTQGLMQLPIENRTHVGIDRARAAAENGRLFQTSGLDLSPTVLNEDAGWSTQDLVFLAKCDVSLDNTLANFGGERRMARVHGGDALANVWPIVPPALTQAINSASGLKLIIATPALFSQGYLPGWIDPTTLEGSPPDLPNVRLRLKAAAIERWIPVSGWNLAEKKPRAMRKAVASGAVYWFECLSTLTEQDVSALWLSTLSDHPQDRRDGFGLCLLSAWVPAAQ